MLSRLAATRRASAPLARLRPRPKRFEASLLSTLPLNNTRTTKMHDGLVPSLQDLQQNPFSLSIRPFSSMPPGGGGINVMNQQEAPSGQHLEQFGVDLTARAMAQKMDPIIGRQDEIRRTLQILSRRTKNNPILIGKYHSFLHFVVSIAI
jgi:ATP-dependent Clp protease ATP-binding subunit ClpA